MRPRSASRVLPCVFLACLLLATGAAAEQKKIRDVSPGITKPVRPGNWITYPEPHDSLAERPLRSVRVDRDGRLQVDGVWATLEGVMPIDAARVCSTPSGQKWACGKRAYIAWRNYFRSGVRCEVKAAIALCTGRDIPSDIWLLKNGWAELKPGEPEAARIEAHRDAQTQQRGIFAATTGLD